MRTMPAAADFPDQDPGERGLPRSLPRLSQSGTKANGKQDKAGADGKTLANLDN